MDGVTVDLDLQEGRLAVARLDGAAPVPPWADGPPLSVVTRSAAELSVVCPEEAVPADVRAERGFRALSVRGPLDFALTGILAALSAPLAGAGVALLAISTFDTDHLLVREADLGRAVAALREAGHRVAGA